MEDSQPSHSRRGAGNYTTNIPFDIVVEVFSHLPGKSLIRFQSLSKQWFSFIRSKNFGDLFLTRSKTRPRLLLPLMHSESGKRFILSAPEHKNKGDDKSLSTVIPRHDMTLSDPFYYMTSRPVNGLIFCLLYSSIAVCNPTTRQIVKLPDVTLNGRYARLGYDPVEDQYKVLMTIVCPFGRTDQQEHYVCTVRSSQEQVWRKIENTTLDNYRTVTGEICIDGALYYGVGQSRIVRFDVRSEKIELIKAPEESDFSRGFPCALLNYNGKLGRLDCGYKRVMRLWILEDAEKQEWSSMTRSCPSELQHLLGSYVMSKGEIHTGELMVFHPWFGLYKPIFVCYYDFKNESIIKQVEIMVDGDLRRSHGIGELTACRMLCYPGYFENIKFL